MNDNSKNPQIAFDLIYTKVLLREGLSIRGREGLSLLLYRLRKNISENVVRVLQEFENDLQTFDSIGRMYSYADESFRSKISSVFECNGEMELHSDDHKVVLDCMNLTREFYIGSSNDTEDTDSRQHTFECIRQISDTTCQSIRVH